MALPTPTGTTLLYSVNGTSWNTFGCVTSISIDESTKTTDVDLINNATTGWSGSIVTSKTRALEVSGLFKNTDGTGALAGAFIDETTSLTTLTEGSAASGNLNAGDNVRIAIAFPGSASDTYDVIRFTRDNAAVSTVNSNEIVWTVESKRIEMSGSNPATYTIRFIINAGSLC